MAVPGRSQTVGAEAELSALVVQLALALVVAPSGGVGGGAAEAAARGLAGWELVLALVS